MDRHYAIAGLSTGMLLVRGWPLIPAFGAGLIVGSAIGCLNGLLAILRPKLMKELANTYLSRMNLKARSIEQKIGTLSGGNQQRSFWPAVSPQSPACCCFMNRLEE